MAFVPLGLPLDTDSPLLSEAELWKFVAARLGNEGVLDVGMPKTRAEYLIHGSAFAPAGHSVSSLAVRARVGRREKSLMVFGDRFWESDSRASAPQSFSTMPLDYTRAYGGPDFAQNPLGRGHAKVSIAEQEVQLLPNLELAEQLLESAETEVTPASYGPLDISWPQRSQYAGTYDQNWLENLFPGLAKDLDWSLFNLAPLDQQLTGSWSPGEVYEFHAMHPTRPQLVGRLPSYTARVFVTRELPAAPGGVPDETPETPATRFDEIPLRLSTLWFFPDAERAVLIFHGSTPITTDTGSDIRHLLVAAERPDERRPKTYYEQLLATRLDPDQAMAATLREHELLPRDLPAQPEETAAKALFATEGLLQRKLHKRTSSEHAALVAQFAAAGVDTSTMPPPPDLEVEAPPLEQLSAYVDELRAKVDARRAEEEAKAVERRAALEDQLRAAGLDPTTILGNPDAGVTGPPTFTAESMREEVLALANQLRAVGAPTAMFETLLADPGRQRAWEAAEVKLRAGYRLTAHHQEPAPPFTPERSAAARAAVLEAHAAGARASVLNFSGADLRGVDLRGADLRGAFLESTRLDGADLREAKLDDAVLAHASLVGTKFDGASLCGANLGKATLRQASFDRCALPRAIFAGADLSEASLRGATLDTTDFHEAKLDGAVLDGLEATGLVLLGVSVTGLSLRGAKLRKCVFIDLDLDAAQLCEAELLQCNFVGCAAAGADFSGARLDRSAFVNACILDNARFVGASLRECNLRGSSMRCCDLSEAQLERADLSACVLTEARFERARARDARFVEADLSRAVLSQANLMGASLKSALLVDADLSGANLHGADMARVRTDGRVTLDGALLTKVRIYPRYADPQTPEEAKHDPR